jgi:hypothetical protein
MSRSWLSMLIFCACAHLACERSPPCGMAPWQCGLFELLFVICCLVLRRLLCKHASRSGVRHVWILTLACWRCQDISCVSIPSHPGHRVPTWAACMCMHILWQPLCSYGYQAIVVRHMVNLHESIVQRANHADNQVINQHMVLSHASCNWRLQWHGQGG